MLYIAFLIFICSFLWVCFCLYSYVLNGCGKFAPFVPTNSKIGKDVRLILKNKLQASKKSLKIVDLGSGTGSVLIPLAKEFPQHRFIGYEWDPILIQISRKKARGLKNIVFKQRNYMKENLSVFNVVFAYVLKAQGDQVGLKLKKELKHESFVVAADYPLSYLKEYKRHKSSRFGISAEIYVYLL